MSSRIAVAVVTLTTVALASGCGHETTWVDDRVIGSGRLATETRPVAAFDALVVDGPLEVRLTAGRPAALEVTAEDNLLPHVRSELRGGSLHLFLDGVSLTSTRGFRVQVSSPAVSAIEANAAARLEVDGLQTDVLVTRLTGASSARLAGSAERHELWLSGASRCLASELRSHDGSAGLSGASYGLVAVGRTLRVDASGASTLEYLGDPQLTSVVSGESTVRRVGP
jgi:hypothetical protein